MKKLLMTLSRLFHKAPSINSIKPEILKSIYEQAFADARQSVLMEVMITLDRVKDELKKDLPEKFRQHYDIQFQELEKPSTTGAVFSHISHNNIPVKSLCKRIDFKLDPIAIQILWIPKRPFLSVIKI